jgi:spore coat protein U-like protein
MQNRAAVLAIVFLLLPVPAPAYECHFGASHLPVYTGGVVQSDTLVVHGDGVVEVVCDANANPLTPVPMDGRVTVTLAATPGSSADFSARILGQHGPRYNIYVNASRSVIWGDGSGGTQVLTHTFTFNPAEAGLGALPFGPAQRHSFPLYGSVRSGLDLRPEPYSDTITATLHY